MGWPLYLIKEVPFRGDRFLALRSETGRSERQWKGILSWMLGVAGTRQVLGSEGYRWIAPLSAFYPEASQAVDVSNWYPPYPPGVLTATRRPGSRSRLRPDYVALRPLRSGLPEWAVAESKGTYRSLSTLSQCPGDWYNQARNIELRLNGIPVAVPRHLVIATRVNPNAKRDNSRRLQLRAWNSVEKTREADLSREFASEIVVAHLFGLFRNLRLVANARALIVSARRRRAETLEQAPLFDQPSDRILKLADAELTRHWPGEDQKLPMSLPIQTDFGMIKVEVAAATLLLARNLQHASNVGVAAKAVQEADRDLDAWESRPRASDTDELQAAILPFGVEVTVPSEVGP
jgi:hypothetical protein